MRDQLNILIDMFTVGQKSRSSSQAIGFSQDHKIRAVSSSIQCLLVGQTPQEEYLSRLVVVASYVTNDNMAVQISDSSSRQDFVFPATRCDYWTTIPAKIRLIFLNGIRLQHPLLRELIGFFI